MSRGKEDEPVTPTASHISSFPSTFPSGLGRRPSITTCSSSSSLYEAAGGSSEQGCAAGIDGPEKFSSDDEYDTDTDGELEDMSKTSTALSRRSQELFRFDWGWSNESKSPTIPKSEINKSRYLQSPKETTPIFKRIVSRNSLKPQLKSFRRITAELQHESIPLENEINHENLTLLHLKDEENYLNEGLKPKNEHMGISKKIDIIQKANESWNQKKHTSLRSHRYSFDTLHTSDSEISVSSPTGTALAPEANLLTRKRSLESELGHKSKRRAVSMSPMSPVVLKRGNMKLMTTASKDLEKMTLDS